MGDFIVISIVVIIIGLILYRSIRNKKLGKNACSSCSGGCCKIANNNPDNLCIK